MSPAIVKIAGEDHLVMTKPLTSVVMLEQGDNWAPLALVDGKLLVRDQKQLKCLQVAH